MASANLQTVHKQPFNQLESVDRLKKLAEDPLDLRKEGVLTPARLSKFYAEAGGYKLLYGTEKVTEETLRALFDLAQERKVLEEMQKMQSGEPVNKIDGCPSENRAALHTATRDFFEEPQKGEKAVEATALARKEVDKLKRFMEKLDKENRFTDLIVIGIGGSDLGPKALYLALQYLQKKGRHIHFISNIDSDDASLVLREVDLKKSLVLVVSKSGTTLETLTNEELVRASFQQQGLRAEDHFISVTVPGSPLDDPERYLESFHMWEWIGGRYSATSMGGGVLLSFIFGFEVYWELLKGANAMDKIALSKDLNRNLPLLGALFAIWNHNFLGYPTLALIPYAQPLSRFAAHIQQVEMESNGKRIDRYGIPVDFQTCPVIWGEPGTNAQHSFFQLIHQGTATIPLELIGFKEGQMDDFMLKGTSSREKLLSNLFAQSLALALGQTNENPNKVFPGNTPSHILLGKSLDPQSLGALLSYYEHKVAFQGFIWNINSFDQEGVQLGKVLANQIIACFASKKGSTKTPKQSYPLGEAFLKHLDTLH
ncbi:glucose-6-phosphate isomerase [Parachlamydia sp. AcF125]|uniref:glucose-6-phosphate isomerase n=1 Tax=Parachlamydia sp. AcF125 TaxID=2795736 RepID=UPI001BC99334|nr:glucose-6-phosphate isomerase [Parachlamydia sp. AcF125]MBS4169144.1 Glucose-6-phosphate isomerase [Parachlamydia sp. AcF125]